MDDRCKDPPFNASIITSQLAADLPRSCTYFIIFVKGIIHPVLRESEVISGKHQMAGPDFYT
jgi:hypothetical protein